MRLVDVAIEIFNEHANENASALDPEIMTEEQTVENVLARIARNCMSAKGCNGRTIERVVFAAKNTSRADPM